MASDVVTPRPRLLYLLLGLLAVLFVFASIDGLTPRAPAQEGEEEGKAAKVEVLSALIWSVVKAATSSSDSAAA